MCFLNKQVLVALKGLMVTLASVCILGWKELTEASLGGEMEAAGTTVLQLPPCPVFTFN